MKRSISILVRCLFLALAAWLIWRLATRADQHLIAAFRQCLQSPYGIAAIVLYFVVQLLGTWRWKILLRAAELDMSFFQCLRLTLGGGFFSLVIPGSVSGDIVKVGAATALHPGKTPELALVDLLDRVIGLAGLFGAGAISFPPLLRILLRQNCQGSALRIAIFVLFGGFVAILSGYTLWKKWPNFRVTLILGRGVSCVNRLMPNFLQRLIQRLVAALELYRERPKAISKAFIISVAIHLMLGIEFFCLGKALNETQMTLPQYVMTTQLANATALLPITPGGLGIRDSVAENLFQSFGANPASVATIIPLFYTAIMIFWGLVGALVFVLTPSPKTISSPENSQGSST